VWKLKGCFSVPNSQRGALLGDFTASGAVCLSASRILLFLARSVNQCVGQQAVDSEGIRRLDTILQLHQQGGSSGSSQVGFVVDKMALGQVFSEYYGFPCQSSFLPIAPQSPSSIIWGCTIGQKWPQYLVT
jgi:hypothetical protein